MKSAITVKTKIVLSYWLINGLITDSTVPNYISFCCDDSCLKLRNGLLKFGNYSITSIKGILFIKVIMGNVVKIFISNPTL